MKKKVNVYRGLPLERPGRCVVIESENDAPLPPRHDLINHSPDGFSWGYGGSGPAQLALAMLAHHLQNDARALLHYQRFKWDYIATLQQDEAWRITGYDIDQWLVTQEVR